MYAVMEEMKRVCERNRRDYEALARMTGKTIAEIEADTTAPDPSEEHLHRLSDSMSATFDTDSGDITLYAIHACSPQRIIVITSEEINELSRLYEDGCCPVCLKEIALYDIICEDCLEDARNARRLKR